MKQFFRLLPLMLIVTVLTSCGEIEFFPDTSQPFKFSIPSKTNVPWSSVITSDGFTVMANSGNSTITITNGEYSLDGGKTWLSTTGTLDANKTVTMYVRHTSAATPLTKTVTTIDFSGRSATFTTTTADKSLYGVKLLTELGAGATTIYGIQFKMELPAGIYVNTGADGAVDAAAITASGSALGSTVTAKFTSPDIDVALAKANGFGAGEFLTLYCQTYQGATLNVAGFRVYSTSIKAVDQNGAALPNVKLKVTQ